MQERRIRIGSLFEWIAAALCVLSIVWVFFAAIEVAFGPRGEGTIAIPGRHVPPGVPANASNIPVMLLLDGREIRQGDRRSHVDEILSDQQADGPARVSHGRFGDRHTRAYVVNGTKIYIVCESTEPDGEMKVSGIYLPSSR